MTLFYIMVLEPLSREFRTGLLWKLLYADGLVFVVVMEGQTEAMETLKR